MIDCINELRQNCTKNSNFYNNCIPLTNEEWSSVISVICIGALIANLGINSIAGSLKKKIIANNVLYALGSVCIIMMSNYYVLLAGRLFIGLSIGVTCSVVPLYLNMIAPQSKRGIFCCMHGCGIVVGVLVGQILAYYFNSSSTWRYSYFMNLVFLLAYTVILFSVTNIESNQLQSDRSDVSVSYLIKNKEARKSLCLGIIVHLTQQLSCINGVIYYSSTILKDTKNPPLYSIGVGVMSVISTFVSLFVIDHFGRKLMFLLSSFITVIGLTCLAFKVNELLSLFIYIAGFNMGLGPVVWMLTGEIFPNNHKKAGATVAVSVNWISNYCVAKAFPIILAKTGSYSFLYYALSVIIAGIYFSVCFKETKGKPNKFQ
ncbi:hypothetical protein BDAP_002666 [Binucleata daphniae]